ncbi:sensor histidine kinase [Luteolibacter sp. SL250]|uniref:sensor histidine kinase n=1 Tax=Luteolibacter sp. SL250 TaxID=2995170 RepID=UPI00226DECBA|nr:sensor histidine kinase [Luteolibacter sp. SL250]WAC19912.1 sensor histidine kinase [Luteolibacter sp. SL250]
MSRRFHFLVIPAIAGALQAQPVAPLPVITEAKELHRLTRAETLLPRQVKIRGVITYKRGDEFNDFAMQDSTGGFIADVQTAIPMTQSLQPGQEIEIEGYTVIDPPPAPRISVTQMKPGPIVGLPAPLPVTPQSLLGGAGVFSYVEFSGVIRSTRIERDLNPHRLVLDLGPPDQRLAVRIARFDDDTISRLTPDTRVRVRGTALAWTSVNLQPYSIFIGVHDAAQVEVLDGTRNPTDIPLTEFGKLVSSHPEGFDARREKLHGVVTLNWPGEMVVVQGNGGAIRAIPAGETRFQVGDEVDVAGFSSAEGGRIFLDEAVFSNVTPGRLPAAEEVEISRLKVEAGTADREAHRVRVTGSLMEITRRDDNPMLKLEWNGSTFDVLMRAGTQIPQDLRKGAVLEVTGVCHYQLGETARKFAIRLDGVEIHLAEMADIRMLSAPPWWTPARLAMVIAVILFILGLSLLWVVALRRRVAVRSAMLVREIRARHDTQLLVSERSRLAADLHDTLSQTLSGAALQMEIADSMDDTTATSHRELARRLLDRSREDLRRAVWDLTPSVLLNQDLGGAFRSIAEEVSAEHTCEVRIDAPEHLPALPERTRSHLLRVGQEAIHNAIRHGGAETVTVSLLPDEGGVLLRVWDDGSGFDPSRAPGPTDGHFGLSSMRNRIQRLGGTFTIRSSPRGTTVTATVPISPMSEDS